MKNTHALLFTLLLFVSANTHAQFWTSLGGPYGGGVFVGYTPNGNLYAQDRICCGVFTPDYFQSTDNALTWHKLPVQPPGDYFYVAADGKLYTWTNSQLYRSDNDGAAWSLVNSQSGLWTFTTKLFSKADGTLFHSYSQKLYRSDDSGATWQQVFDFYTIANFGSPDEFYVDPASGDIFAFFQLTNPYAANLYRSSDNGISWQLIFTEGAYWYGNGPVIHTNQSGHIFLSGAASGKIHRSTDGGATWQTLQINFGSTNFSEVDWLTITATGRLICNLWYKSFYSDDNGDTWQELPGVWSQAANEFTALPNGLVLARPGSIWRSTDDGMSFSFAATGIPNSSVNNIAIVDNNELFASTNDGLFKTADGGVTWQLLHFAPEIAAFYNVAFAKNEQGHLFLSGGNKLWRSLDGGTTFTDNSPPLQNWEDISTIATIPGGTVFLDAGQVFKSDDNGDTWTALGVDAPNFTHMEMHPSGYLLAFYYGGLFKSLDGGNTWEFVMTPFTSGGGNNFAIGTAGEIYLGGQNYFFWSNDNGVTWDSSSVSPPPTNLFYPDHFTVNSAGHIYTASVWNDNILRSVDKGLSWNSIPLINGNLYGGDYTAIRFSPTDHFFTGTAGYGIFRTSKTTTALTYATGKAWHDLVDDCLASPADTLLPRVFIRAQGQSGPIFGFADSQASYILPVEQGSYNVEVIPPSPYWESCVTPLNVPQSALLTTIDSVDVRLGATEHCPFLEVELATGFLRRCFPGNYALKWCNKGTTTAVNATVTVTLDSFLTYTGATVQPVSIIGNEVTFPLGDVKAGECGQFILYFEVSCNAALGQMHCSTAHALPDTICPDWTGPVIRLEGDCNGSEALFTIHNDGNDMTSPLDWAWWKMIDQDNYEHGSGTFQLAAGGSQTVAVPVNGQVVHFTAQKPAGYPFGEYVRLRINNCNPSNPALPLSIAAFNNDDEPFFDENCMTNIGSFDPNDKTGFPEGLGEKGRIEREQELEYLIRFQNTGTDTAFNITVRDTLSPWLDPASVRPGASSHPYEMQLSGKGILVFKFSQIMLPDSNINEAASHGFVSFTVLQQPGNPDDTEIENRAAIYFDFNEPVMTNTTLHTVGLPALVATHERKARPALDMVPNPFSEKLTVRLEQAGTYRFRFFDALGKTVDTGVFSGKELVYQNGGLAAGLYWLEILTEQGKQAGAGKVVKF